MDRPVTIAALAPYPFFTARTRNARHRAACLFPDPERSRHRLVSGPMGRPAAARRKHRQHPVTLSRLRDADRLARSGAGAVMAHALGALPGMRCGDTPPSVLR